jgi:FG-GAP-like repeat
MHLNDRLARTGLRRIVSAIVCAAFGIAALAFVRPAHAASPESQHARPRTADRAPLNGYRLGNAAQPFGWSTAIADFNKDGRPDYAIVDRSTDANGTYTFQLQLSISGREPEHAIFSTSHRSVTVAVVDFDHDRDVDLVISLPLSDEVLRVWLNDGDGRFTLSERIRPAIFRLSRQALAPERRRDDVCTLALANRRVEDAVWRVAESTCPLSLHALARHEPQPSDSAPSTSTAAPRAPPSHLLS